MTIPLPLTLVLGALALIGIASLPNPRPALVGYGCEGASGPLYANAEDHFPICRDIQAND